MRRTTTVALGATAAVLNANFLIELVVPTHLSPVGTMVSELSATGRPDAWAFRVGDGVAGALAVLLGLLLVGRPGTRMLAWCALVFGASTTLSAAVTLPCAGGTAPACAGGATSGAELFHDSVSVLGTTAAVGGTWLLLRLLRAGRGWRLRACAATAAVVASATGLAFVVDHSLAAVPGIGLAQRAQVVAISVWLLLLGVVSPRGAAPGPAAPASSPRRALRAGPANRRS